MTIHRLRVPWTGSAVVGGGLTTFYGNGATGGVEPAAVRSFFDAIKAFFPSGIDWVVPDGGDTLQEASGDLIGSWAKGGGGTVSGTASAAYAAGVGARVVWRTSAVFRGRRVRGSTFLVPLTSAQYENDGSLTNATRTALNTAASVLVAAPNPRLVVWSRPGPGWAGVISEIDSAEVPDKVSWLRSRRT